MILALALALSYGALSPRPIEETYALQFHPVAGEAWALRGTFELNTSEFAGRGTGLLQVKVGEVRGDGSYDLGVTVTDLEITREGKTVQSEDSNTEMKLGADGGAALVASEDAASPASVLLAFALSYAPRAPVKVGGSWDAVFPVGVKGERARFTLVGEERKYDLDVLRLDVKGPLEGFGMVAGSLWILPKTFRLAGADLRMELTSEKFGESSSVGMKLRPGG